MEYVYHTKGTCSSQITFDIENGVVTNVRFRGGCNGNLQGISRLVDGKTVDEIEGLLQGVKCGFKSTSCPDQLAKAVRQAQNELAN
ncbi:MAG: TIGR03905 family TSCPD domain-containing protein [Bacteroides sp.]|nr:TIGR03905 family TSCPD domain-containing protein [Bacillota bacterium]MCM1393951.1 TIGR03905 family TSCPD domain-containing protein [[Eubacterium] siraeum]MCM1455141.1 TIGR03905 family TSCPD domain-containing protein [Bacteroides sp.]